MEVPVVLFNCGFEDPSGEVYHHLGEDIFAFIHNLWLLAATNLAKRSLQIVKCQRAILNNLQLRTCNDVESIYRIGKRFKSRTSQNVSKTLDINKLYKQRVKLTHH